MSERLDVKIGMYVKLKNDISLSLKEYGKNREKIKFAGGIRRIIDIQENGVKIILKRTYDLRRKIH